MKSVLFLLVFSLIICKSLTASALPNWIINPNIDAGQVVSVNFAGGDSLFAASRSKQQHFNKTNFAVVPRVILSMIGYGNLPPGSASTPIGFKTVIDSRNSTHFNYTTTAYAVVIYLLNYLYLAIQYEDTAFYTDTQFLTFNSSTNSNVFNEIAAVRYDTIAIANPGGMFNSNFTGQDIQFIAFPTGFNLLPKSGRSYFSINASILNNTHYSVNISTIGNNILYEISFSVLAFNRGVIMANYTVFIDLVLSTLTGNSTAYVTPPFTPQQYMFRNCLAGGIHAEYPATASFVYYYTMSSPANDFVIWRTFNNRIRSCQVNLTYYEPTSGLCYDICPALYNSNATSLLCLPCHYSCQQCSEPYSSTVCTFCSLTNKRILNGTQCLCDVGFFDNGVALCSACNNECLTCFNGTNSSCSSCSAALSRQLDPLLSICNCQSSYYENMTCLPCSSQMVACFSCTYDVQLNNLTCITCNSSLFRILQNDSKACICQSGYFQNTTCIACTQMRGCLTCKYDIILNNLTCLSCDSSVLRVLSNDSKSCQCQPQYYEDPTNFTCLTCPVGCLLCQAGPICSFCDSTLNRTMGSANSSCDCIATYFQNGSGLCVACPFGCVSCVLGAAGPVCSSCDAALNRAMDLSNTSCVCKGGFYEEISNNCTLCPVGCLVCSLSGGSVVCSSCDSAINRIMGSANLTCLCSATFYQTANGTCQPCTNVTNCTNCASGNYITINNTCSPCSPHCSNCSTSPSFTQICNACASNYNLVNATCILETSICGDGVLSGTQQCDDNNLANTDGCSSVCKIQVNHACINNASILNHSLCYYSYPIGLNPQLVYKIPGQNSVKLQLSVDAPLCNPVLLGNYLELTSYVSLFDRTRLLQTAWIAIPTKQVSFSSLSMILTILFDYSQDIDLSLKDIQISASSTASTSYLKYFYASPSAKASLSSPYNNLPTKFYSTSSLQAVSAFSKVFLALVGLYWIAVIISFVAQKGAVGTECMLVLQLTYLTLLDIPQLGQCWSGLQLSGRFTFGYNLSLLKNSEADDLKALELDSNLPNTLNITLGILLVLFLSVIGLRIYEWWMQRKKRKELMEINESSQNRSTKIQKQEEYKFQRVFVVVIDIMMTLLFLTTPIAIIGISFTSSASLIGNLIEIAVMVIIILASWLLFYRRSQTYAWRTISFRSIIVNPAKMNVNFGLKILLKHYYFLQFIFISIIALMIAFLKSSGMIVFILLLLGSAGFSLLHFQIQIYRDRLHSLRAVSNSAALALIMLLHLVQYYAANSLDTSLSLVVVTFLLMLTVLTINLIVLLILWKRQNEKERDQAHLDMQMKQMANQLGLGLANMSMQQGQDINYGSIKHNNSRDYTKPKAIEQDYDSTRSELLNKSKNQKLYGLIEQKIRQLKEFKKNIQAQVEGSNFISEDTSEGNNNLEGILDQLQNKSNILGEISNI